jgi:mannosyltransferase OCH1-like enzyme
MDRRHFLVRCAAVGSIDNQRDRFAFADAMLGIQNVCRTPAHATHVIKAIHQILIVDGLKEVKTLHTNIAKNIDAIKRLCPLAQHRLWHGEALREMIGNHFDRSVLKAFDTLRPYAFKADLAKYCLIYHFGWL